MNVVLVLNGLDSTARLRLLDLLIERSPYPVAHDPRQYPREYVSIANYWHIRIHYYELDFGWDISYPTSQPAMESTWIDAGNALR